MLTRNLRQDRYPTHAAHAAEVQENLVPRTSFFLFHIA
jgi:hypothetical protein